MRGKKPAEKPKHRKLVDQHGYGVLALPKAWLEELRIVLGQDLELVKTGNVLQWEIVIRQPSAQHVKQCAGKRQGHEQPANVQHHARD